MSDKGGKIIAGVLPDGELNVPIQVVDLAKRIPTSVADIAETLKEALEELDADANVINNKGIITINYEVEDND